MMDVGATLCRQRDPLCGRCPLRAHCRYAAAGVVTGPRIAAARRRPSGRDAPFPATRRWLRGRLLARLREQSDGRWLEVSGPVGGHPAASVADALDQLARDGLLERDPLGRVRLPVDPA
jgi:A/G-specific adenine glycosylase